MITPLATQLTYEGLIDEIYGISNCTGKFPAEMFPATDDKISGAMAEKKKKKIVLNSADKLFAELRDKNFRAVGQSRTDVTTVYHAPICDDTLTIPSRRSGRSCRSKRN